MEHPQTAHTTFRAMSPQPAFSVGRAVRGTAHTFQVDVDAHEVYFIRIGMGPGTEAMLAMHGGLIGWLLSRWFSSHQKKKRQQRVEEHKTRTLAQMLAEHKANQAIRLADIQDVSLEPGGWTLARGSVNWCFQVRGERKRVLCTFRSTEDVTAGIAVLSRLFPGMRIDVQFDPKAGKYLKK